MTAIGVDESTHLPLDWIRYIFTRNRSTDPDIKTRLRLGTNPGNISSKDQELAVYATARRFQDAETAYYLSQAIRHWYLVALALNLRSVRQIQ